MGEVIQLEYDEPISVVDIPGKGLYVGPPASMDEVPPEDLLTIGVSSGWYRIAGRHTP